MVFGIYLQNGSISSFNSAGWDLSWLPILRLVATAIKTWHMDKRLKMRTAWFTREFYEVQFSTSLVLGSDTVTDTVTLNRNCSRYSGLRDENGLFLLLELKSTVFHIVFWLERWMGIHLLPVPFWNNPQNAVCFPMKYAGLLCEQQQKRTMKLKTQISH